MGARVTKSGTKTDDMLSLKEAAIILGVAPGTISKHVATGKLPVYKITGSKAYYIKTDDLNRYEQDGIIKPRKKRKVEEDDKPKSSDAILETMTEDQQKLLLEAIASTTKLLVITTDPDQIGMIKANLRSLIDGPLFEAVLAHAPEFVAM